MPKLCTSTGFSVAARRVAPSRVFSISAQTAMQTETPTQPVLYLHGASDGCIGVELAHDARTRKPANAEVVVVEGAGHFLQLERPDAVNALIVDWVTAG